jgi:hypothetical protein
VTAQQTLFAADSLKWRWRGLEGTSSARFSPCERYRYELRRTWDATRRPMVAICCNPSVATALVDDATCRRLYDFGDRWGHGGLILLNAFALRSTDPRALRAEVRAGRDPVGEDNDMVIRDVLAAYRSDRLLLAWGGDARLNDRGRRLAAMALEIHGSPVCLGLTAGGEPRHPLYVPRAMPPLDYSATVADHVRS